MNEEKFNNSHRWQYFGHNGRIYVSRIIGTTWKHCNAAEQQNEQINEAMRQITNVIKRTQKRGRCQNIAKYITEMLNTKKVLNEHKLQTNTTACKCLNNSRHGNLLLRK